MQVPKIPCSRELLQFPATGADAKSNRKQNPEEPGNLDQRCNVMWWQLVTAGILG